MNLSNEEKPCSYCEDNNPKGQKVESIMDVFRIIYETRGIDALKSKYIVGLISDYAPSMTRERNLVSIAVQSGAYRAICEATEIDRVHVLNRYVSILSEYYSIDETWAKEVLSWCLYAISPRLLPCDGKESNNDLSESNIIDVLIEKKQSYSNSQQTAHTSKKATTDKSKKRNGASARCRAETYDSTRFKSKIDKADAYMSMQKIDLALKEYHKLARAGYVPAYNSIANIYLLRKNYYRAWQWYLKAAELGDKTGEFFVGYFYLMGYHVKQDFAVSFSYFEKSANQGMIEATYWIALFYKTGCFCNLDHAKAAEYYEIAANGGYAPAQFEMGCILQTGDGVDKDILKAAIWFQKAYSQGITEAKDKLSECLSRMTWKQRRQFRKTKFH